MKKGYTLIEAVIAFVIVGIVLVILPLIFMWTDRNIDYALTLLKGHPVNCPFWLSSIAAIVFNGVTIAFNVVMEIIRFCK